MHRIGGNYVIENMNRIWDEVIEDVYIIGDYGLRVHRIGYFGIEDVHIIGDYVIENMHRIGD